MPTPLETAIAERDAALVGRDAALVERDTAVAERNSALVDRNEALTGRDAARTERDDAVTAKGKAAAKLKGQTDLATQHKGERDDLKVEVREKIDEGQEISKKGKELLDRAKGAQVKAQDVAKAAVIARAKAVEAQAVSTKKSEDLQVSVAAHAKAIDKQGATIAEQEETLRAMDGQLASGANKIKELESTVAEQTQELLRLRPARPITP